MLHTARKAGRPIVIKSHIETTQGYRPGHFTADMLGANEYLWTAPTPPQELFAGADAIYVATSQLGFEAILAGHRPVVFGEPFYAGWGLSEDRLPISRRTRTLTAQQLFAAACLLYPVWYDPCTDRLCDFETALDQLTAETRAWREDHAGWDGHNIRLWKRGPLQQVFGGVQPMRFKGHTPNRRQMTWGTGTGPKGTVRVEDGFLRSRGLGADLVPPLSLIIDDIGLYFDPTRPSGFERLVQAADLTTRDRTRTAQLITSLIQHGVSKYMPPAHPLPPLPAGQKVLVPGQVEDDASIRLGAVDICTNADLLAAVRTALPDAVILYKPHPDVEAGLRPGRVRRPEEWANVVLDHASPATCIEACDAVWTMTSLLGFEALLRGKHVTCLGLPFYAGWGLTDDHHPCPRRTARPDLLTLVHTALIAYPRYYDPVTRRATTAEVVVDRLRTGKGLTPPPGLRILAKLQGALAGQAYLWRQSSFRQCPERHSLRFSRPWTR